MQNTLIILTLTLIMGGGALLVIHHTFKLIDKIIFGAGEEKTSENDKCVAENFESLKDKE